jgi:hypothetical protein
MELKCNGCEATAKQANSGMLAQEFWQQARPRTGSGIGHTAQDENAACRQKN